MILNVICDQCESASATHVVFETKWKQEALCAECHELIDHDALYDCKLICTDVKAELKGIIAAHPGALTKQLVAVILDNYVVPIFFVPFDSVVKEALRDRSCFRATKVGTALAYEVVEGRETS